MSVSRGRRDDLPPAPCAAPVRPLRRLAQADRSARLPLLAGRTAALQLLTLLTAAAGLSAPVRGETPWLSGEALERRLETPLPVLTWQDVPLRDGLQRLARSQQVAVLLDRRVDPGREVTFESRGRTVEETLRELARRVGLGASVVGAVVYLGPPETARVLSSVAEQRMDESRSQAGPLRERLTQPRPSAWPMLATPRDVLRQTADELGLRWRSLEAIPHDLLPETQWPPMTGPCRLTLLLAGFGRTYRLQDGELQLAPLPATAARSASYTAAGSQMSGIREAVAAENGARLTVAGSRVRVTGSADLHRRLRRLLRPGRTTGPVRTAYTLTVDNQPAGAVIGQLAQQLGLKLVLAPGLERQLARRISFHVEDADRATLLEAMLQPAGLRGAVDGDQLRVEAR